MNGTPEINKFSNDNPFLNSLNDLTRAAYSNHTKATELHNKPVNRLEDNLKNNLILNSKEEFETNNQRINSLNEEIQSLKRKLKTIYEKEEEIYKLQCEIKQLKQEIQDYELQKSELEKLKLENKQLRDINDRTQIQIMNNQSLTQENKLLKKKLKEIELKEGDEDTDIGLNTNIDIETEDYKDDKSNDKGNELTVHEEIQINVPQLKIVLYNRLKEYHEKHIDELISYYKLESKESIDKLTMEKILLEAIHI